MHSSALLTTLSSQDKESILSLSTDDQAGHIFGGSQSGDIHVWSLRTFFPVTRLVGHKSSVLCLTISTERSLLFSSSGDNTVRLWDTSSFGHALYIVKPPIASCGDVLSLAWSDQFSILYLGCQDTSIQWIHLPPSMTNQVSPSELDQPPRANSTTAPSSPFPFSGSATASCLPSPPLLAEANSTLLRSSSITPLQFNRPMLHHKFFDSKSQAELLKAARLRDSSNQQTPLLQSISLEPPDFHSKLPERFEGSSNHDSRKKDEGSQVLFINNDDSVPYAHFGYIYCLLLISLNNQLFLISGSGDSTIKLWPLDPHNGRLIPQSTTLLATTSSYILPTAASPEPSEDVGAVLTLAACRSTLYAGYQDGIIKIWDLDTLTCVRTLFHCRSSDELQMLSKDSDDVLTVTALDNGELFSGCSGGVVMRWNSSFQRVSKWESHQGSALASCSLTYQGKMLFLTGGSDNCIKIWDVNHAERTSQGVLTDELETIQDQPVKTMAFLDRMFRHLSQFVSYQSISNEEHREDCRQAALYLKTTLSKLGAEARLLPGHPGRNPLVLATFKGSSSSDSRKRVLYYGHYDVVQAGDSKNWKVPAFTMTGRNGWLYGRGVTDNKGPTLAVAYAVNSLLDQKSLDVDVVMLVEGEEEAGSVGFRKAVQENKELIGHIDVVLVSNSYWLDDETPCITFGLRGVIHATVKVSSSQPDLHSGMHGGAVHEPVLDLVRVLSELLDGEGKIRLDGFYECVKPIDAGEETLFDRIVEHVSNVGNVDLLKHSPIGDVRETLLAKWRQPSLSIHKIDVTGPAHATVIPASAQSAVSIRIVPNQSLHQITSSLISFLEASFQRLNSSNTLEVKINQTADWWLGHPRDPHSVALAECVEENWGIKPLWIREGGTIPSVPFLEQEFNARAIHLPMGSASDSAHLSNERIKMINLEVRYNFQFAPSKNRIKPSDLLLGFCSLSITIFFPSFISISIQQKGSNVVANFLKKVALLP